jgi:3-dehydroquinate dehydratase
MDRLLILKDKFEELKKDYPTVANLWINIIDSRIDIINYTCNQAEDILNHIKHQDESIMENINNQKLLFALYLLKMNNYLNNT